MLVEKTVRRQQVEQGILSISSKPWCLVMLKHQLFYYDVDQGELQRIPMCLLQLMYSGNFGSLLSKRINWNEVRGYWD